jgi:hypothetical protein
VLVEHTYMHRMTALLGRDVSTEPATTDEAGETVETTGADDGAE